MKQRIPKAIYREEFLEKTAKQVTKEGLSETAVTRCLSLPPSTLTSWVKASKTGKLGAVGKTQRPLTEVDWNWPKQNGDWQKSEWSMTC